ncbi:hypothetical protein AOLI_G00082190 [Acnodon oligacanthus]
MCLVLRKETGVSSSGGTHHTLTRFPALNPSTLAFKDISRLGDGVVRVRVLPPPLRSEAKSSVSRGKLTFDSASDLARAASTSPTGREKPEEPRFSSQLRLRSSIQLPSCPRSLVLPDLTAVWLHMPLFKSSPLAEYHKE